MKPLFILVLLITACSNNKKQKAQLIIPVDSMASIPSDTSLSIHIQKSPTEKHVVFRVDATKKGTLKIENQSK